MTEMAAADEIWIREVRAPHPVAHCPHKPATRCFTVLATEEGILHGEPRRGKQEGRACIERPDLVFRSLDSRRCCDVFRSNTRLADRRINGSFVDAGDRSERPGDQMEFVLHDQRGVRRLFFGLPKRSRIWNPDHPGELVDRAKSSDGGRL